MGTLMMVSFPTARCTHPGFMSAVTPGLQWNSVVIELQDSRPFEHMINFRGSFVVVRSAVLGDLNAMKGCGGVVRLR